SRARGLSLRVYGVPPRRPASSAADDPAPPAVAGIVGQRRRRVHPGDPELPGARSLAARAPVRTGAPVMNFRLRLTAAAARQVRLRPAGAAAGQAQDITRP